MAKSRKKVEFKNTFDVWCPNCGQKVESHKEAVSYMLVDCVKKAEAETDFYERDCPHCHKTIEVRRNVIVNFNTRQM